MISKEQILIQRCSKNFPIIVYPEKEVLRKLREHFGDYNINLKSEFEIHSMTDAKEMGGIVCEIRPKGVYEKDLESYFICSLTHFKVKRGEQNHKEIEKYRIKRIRWLVRKNNGQF